MERRGFLTIDIYYRKDEKAKADRLIQGYLKRGWWINAEVDEIDGMESTQLHQDMKTYYYKQGG